MGYILFIMFWITFLNILEFKFKSQAVLFKGSMLYKKLLSMNNSARQSNPQESCMTERPNPYLMPFLKVHLHSHAP